MAASSHPDSPDTSNALLQAAQTYAERGWHVLPLCPGEKTPITKRGVHDASMDAEQISAWWQEHPTANIGISAGRSGLIVCDFDKRHDGLNTLRALQTANGPLRTMAVKTGGGGLHFYYQCDQPIRSRAGVMRGFDVKSDAGYVVAPPSTLRGGGAYELANGAVVAPLPLWLRDTVCTSAVNAEALPQEAHEAPSIEALRDTVDNTANDARFCTRTDFIQFLYAVKAAGAPFDEADVASIVHAWAARWEHGENDPELVQRELDSLRGPYRVGYDYLRQMADGAHTAQEEFTADPLAVRPIETPASNGLPRAIRALDVPPAIPVRFLSSPLVIANEFTMLVGDGGTGKTTILEHIAGAIAGGYSLFDMFDSVTTPILFWSEEDDASIVQNRLHAFCAGHGWDRDRVLSNVHILAKTGATLEAIEWQTQLIAEVRRTGAGLVVLDNLAELTAGAENDSVAAKAVVRVIRKVMTATGCAVILVHHSSKAGDGGKRRIDRAIRGSSVFFSAARAVYMLELAEAGNVTLACLKNNRTAKPSPFTLALDIEEVDSAPGTWASALWVPVAEEVGTNARADDHILRQLLQKQQECGERMNSTQLRQSTMGTGLSNEDIAAATKRLHGRGVLDCIVGKKNAKLWGIADASAASRAINEHLALSDVVGDTSAHDELRDA